MTHRNMINGNQQQKSQTGNIIARIAELSCYDHTVHINVSLSLVPRSKVISEYKQTFMGEVVPMQLSYMVYIICIQYI